MCIMKIKVMLSTIRFSIQSKSDNHQTVGPFAGDITSCCLHTPPAISRSLELSFYEPFKCDPNSSSSFKTCCAFVSQPPCYGFTTFFSSLCPEHRNCSYIRFMGCFLVPRICLFQNAWVQVWGFLTFSEYWFMMTESENLKVILWL